MSARTRWIAIALFAGVAIASTGPIRSYDLFWHLATGRWIVEHRALPATDPFSIASDRHEWINGEWLFEVAAHGVERIAGIAGLSWLRGIFTAALFTILWLVARRDAPDEIALLLTTVAFAGALRTLDMRPSGIAAMFVVLALVVRGAAGWFLLSVVWINVHPSALIAPVVAAVRQAGTIWPARPDVPRRKLPLFAASAAGLLVNPHGIAAITAPLELMSWVRSGAFVNAEWLPSWPRAWPLLWICIAVAALALALPRDRTEHWWRAVLGAMFAALAVRHLRNQALFFAAFPILVAPAIRSIRAPRVLASVAAAVSIGILALTSDHRTGVAPERFPVRAVARLRESGLQGNVYTADQFGGLIIWSLYPERRTLIDGRNELFRQLIPELARSRVDEKAWRALLARYRIDLAVEEYRRPLDVVDGATGRKTSMPASLAYWPRREWALVAYDDAAMVFARRAAFPPEELRRWEIAGVVPDALRVN